MLQIIRSAIKPFIVVDALNVRLKKRNECAKLTPTAANSA